MNPLERAAAEAGVGPALLGILLAAGPGTRLGMPGALMRHPDGVPWVVRSASLRAGLTWALAQETADLALVHMVNKPGTTTEVLRRVLTAAGTGPTALARAGIANHATHPVVMGRTHWQPALESAHGDRAAGPYLKRAPCPLIPSG